MTEREREELYQMLQTIDKEMKLYKRRQSVLMHEAEISAANTILNC